MKVTGKLAFKGNTESGNSKAGKPWIKKQFAIDVEDKYPYQIAFDIFKDLDKIQMIDDTSIGTNIEVEFTAKSREWQGKYFTNLSAWNINVVREGATQAGASNFDNDADEDLPF